MIQHIINNDHLLAIILRRDFQKEGIHFFTPDDFSQQLAYMNRDQGYVIAPHTHNPVERQVFQTQEVLMIKSGRLRVDFYDDNRVYLQSTELSQGDVILLAQGGHGFKMLEKTEMIEVKQGPYTGDADKTRFEPIDDSKVLFREMK
jgi:mannose-6-phosphate isomerase-like protein (cupin superfamily)